MTRPPATIAHLEWAKEWIDQYEPGDDADEQVSQQAILAFLEAEICKRQAKAMEDRVVRLLARKMGLTTNQLRKLPNFREKLNKTLAEIRSGSGRKGSEPDPAT